MAWRICTGYGSQTSMTVEASTPARRHWKVWHTARRTLCSYTAECLFSGDEVANRLGESGCDAQVVMITAIPPSPEMAGLPIDDYVLKLMRREQLRSMVETAALVRTYDDGISKLLGLIARQQLLEAEVPADELETSEEFARLVKTITDREDSADDTMNKLWSQSETNLFARISGELIGNQGTNRRGDTPI